MIGKTNTGLVRAGRLLVAALGGYGFAAGFVGLLGAILVRLGMVRSEAAMAGAMLGMLVFLAIAIWAVSSARPVRAAIIIFAAACAMIAAAPLIALG